MIVPKEKQYTLDELQRILNGNSFLDILDLFHSIKEMPRKKKKFVQKQFNKYCLGAYEKLSNL